MCTQHTTYDLHNNPPIHNSYMPIKYPKYPKYAFQNKTCEEKKNLLNKKEKETKDHITATLVLMFTAEEQISSPLENFTQCYTKMYKSMWLHTKSKDNA